MSGHIRRCDKDRTYTLKNQCPVCGDAISTPTPHVFHQKTGLENTGDCSKNGRYNNPLS